MVARAGHARSTPTPNSNPTPTCIPNPTPALAVAFIQILKSVTPVITLVLLVAFQIERPTAVVWSCVLMISAGAAIASLGELAFSAWGVFLMLCACLCEGIRLVLTQKLLVNLKVRARGSGSRSRSRSRVRTTCGSALAAGQSHDGGPSSAGQSHDGGPSSAGQSHDGGPSSAGQWHDGGPSSAPHPHRRSMRSMVRPD